MFDRRLEIKKQKHITSQLEKNKSDLETTWNIINRVLGRKRNKKTAPFL